MDWNLATQIVAIVTSGCVGLVTLTWWLSRQFSEQTEHFFKRMDDLFEKLAAKLEYHEKHDDQRFAAADDRLTNIRNDIWEIRVRNSAKDIQMKTISDDIKQIKKHHEIEEVGEDQNRRRSTRTASIS